VLNGNMTALGGATNTDVGFQWGTDSALVGASNHTVDTAVAVAPHAYSYTPTGLSLNKKYYFRAWSRDNSTGSFQTGSILSFTTTDSTSTSVTGVVTLVQNLFLAILPLFIIVGVFGAVIGLVMGKKGLFGKLGGGK
jgi:hypothetical protein